MNVKPLILLVCLSAADAAAQDNAEKGPAAATPIAFQVLETQQINLGNRSIFYHRIVPPNLSEPPPPPIPLAPPPLSPDEEAIQWEQKEHKFAFLSATVYDRRLTELRWNDETREYRAFSNVDFNYFTGFTGFNDFQTKTASYFFFLGIGNESNQELDRLVIHDGFSPSVKQALRSLAQLPRSQPSYVLVEEKPVSPQNKNALVDLDALHAYYAANGQKMQENFRRQEAENAARESWLKEHPPIPKDTVIHFWPKKNSRYLTPQEGPK